MATLRADFTLPLRSFELELALEVEGTVALVGPSGAGKTSVLRAIAGLVRPPRGRIALGDEVWLDSVCRLFRKPDERRVGLVFQEYALFPHLTVRQNVAYAGKQRVDEYLERFRISHLAQAKPTALSGGERQRVALARALARGPGVILLDEPLSHDFEDAAALADQVGVIVDGQLRQFATPSELVDRPTDAFVASFTGANLLRGKARRLDDDMTLVQLDTGELVYSTEWGEGDVGVVIYPWEVSIGRLHQDDSAMNLIQGEIRSVTAVGNRVRVRIGPITAEVTASSADKLELARGGTVYATFKATGTRLVPLA
jgi:molybdate transport system ATP-binding protein